MVVGIFRSLSLLGHNGETMRIAKPLRSIITICRSLLRLFDRGLNWSEFRSSEDNMQVGELFLWLVAAGYLSKACGKGPRGTVWYYGIWYQQGRGHVTSLEVYPHSRTVNEDLRAKNERTSEKKKKYFDSRKLHTTPGRCKPTRRTTMSESQETHTASNYHN